MIIILMATFNGAKFIREQLDSILNQTYTDWKLIIRDDNSADDTLNIIKEYCAVDGRLVMINEGYLHGSAVGNFSALFDYALYETYDYMMFADQDDIWLPHKIQDSLSYIKNKESFLKPLTPVLIFSDFQYMDIHGKDMDEMLKMPSQLKLPILVNENHAYGCTMIFNKFLSYKIGKIPLSAENHDYWIALVACCFGETYFNKAKLLRYRQHSNNVSGGVKNRTFMSRFARYVEDVNYLLPLLLKRIKMNKTFLYTYGNVMTKSQSEFFRGYFESLKSNVFELIFWMLKNRVRKLGLMQTIAHYYLIILLRKKIAKYV